MDFQRSPVVASLITPERIAHYGDLSAVSEPSVELSLDSVFPDGVVDQSNGTLLSVRIVAAAQSARSIASDQSGDLHG